VADVEQLAFREFVAAQSARLFQVALALTGRYHAAEDLLQGALVRTYSRWRYVGDDPEAYSGGTERKAYQMPHDNRNQDRVVIAPADGLPVGIEAIRF